MYGFVQCTSFVLGVEVMVPLGWYAPTYIFVKTQTGQEVGITPLLVVYVGAMARGGNASNKAA